MIDGRRFVVVEDQPAPVPSHINLVLEGLARINHR
jgi:hypothetical protein